MQSVPDRVAEESEFIGVCLFGKNGQSLQNTKVSWKHAWVKYADSKQQHAKYEFRIQVSALPLTENLKGNECPPRTACAKNSEGFRIFKAIVYESVKRWRIHGITALELERLLPGVQLSLMQAQN